MKEIYTPKEWSRFFGGAPSLYIKDDGYIYIREEEVKLMGRPCGRIDYNKGRIYGSDYASVNPDPVGYIEVKNEVTEIYAEYPGWNVKPILVIKGNEIYTYTEYTRIMGGNVSGYIKTDGGTSGGGTSGGGASSGGTSGGGASGGGASGGGTSGGGNGSGGVTPPISGEEWRRERVEHELEMQRIRNRNAIRAAKKQEYKNNPQIAAAAREHAQQRAKNATIFAPIFFTLLCIGGFKKMTSETILPVIAIVGLFVLVMTLLIRHKTYKDAFEQKVWELGEQGYGSESVEQPQSKDNQPTTESEATHTPDPEPKPAGSKIVACPHCGAKCKIPVGIGTIQITCPNPGCTGKTFIIDS